MKKLPPWIGCGVGFMLLQQAGASQGPIDAEHPNWSPDGSRLIFAARQDQSLDLFTACINGSNPLRLTKLAQAASYPQWSEDGDKVYFHRAAPGKFDFAISVLSMADGSISKLDLPAPAFEPAISSDGRRLAFTNLSPRGESRTVTIKVLDLITGEWADIGNPGASRQMPHWGVNDVLFFQRRDKGDWEIWKSAPPYNNEQLVLQGYGWSFQHPNTMGTRLAFDIQPTDDASRMSREIASLQLDQTQGNPHQWIALTENKVRDGYPKLSPNGHMVAFHRKENDHSSVVILADGEERTLTASMPAELAFNAPGELDLRCPNAADPGH